MFSTTGKSVSTLLFTTVVLPLGYAHLYILAAACPLTSKCLMNRSFFRDLAKGPRNAETRKVSSTGTDLGATMKQVHDNAKEERRKKYCCVRGSSALNSLSGTDAFRMSIVR